MSRSNSLLSVKAIVTIVAISALTNVALAHVASMRAAS